MDPKAGAKAFAADGAVPSPRKTVLACSWQHPKQRNCWNEAIAIYVRGYVDAFSLSRMPTYTAEYGPFEMLIIHIFAMFVHLKKLLQKHDSEREATRESFERLLLWRETWSTGTLDNVMDHASRIQGILAELSVDLLTALVQFSKRYARPRGMSPELRRDINAATNALDVFISEYGRRGPSDIALELEESDSDGVEDGMVYACEIASYTTSLMDLIPLLERAVQRFEKHVLDKLDVSQQTAESLRFLERGPIRLKSLSSEEWVREASEQTRRTGLAEPADNAANQSLLERLSPIPSEIRSPKLRNVPENSNVGNRTVLTNQQFGSWGIASSVALCKWSMYRGAPVMLLVIALRFSGQAGLFVESTSYEVSINPSRANSRSQESFISSYRPTEEGAANKSSSTTFPRLGSVVGNPTPNSTHPISVSWKFSGLKQLFQGSSGTYTVSLAIRHDPAWPIKLDFKLDTLLEPLHSASLSSRGSAAAAAGVAAAGIALMPFTAGVSLLPGLLFHRNDRHKQLDTQHNTVEFGRAPLGSLETLDDRQLGQYFGVGERAEMVRSGYKWGTGREMIARKRD